MPTFTYSAETGKKFEDAKPLPEGDYLARITAAENTIAKSGNPMIKVDLTVDGARWPIPDWLVFTEKSFPKICSAVRSCGLNSKMKIEEGECEIDASDFEGATCRVHLKIEEYNGKESNRVAYYIDDWRDNEGKPTIDPEDDCPF